MIDNERIYKYMELLECRRHVTASEFQILLEISKATFKRDLAILRDRFDVPIIFDRDIGAYKLDANSNKKPLPGIWFSPKELQTLIYGLSELERKSESKNESQYQPLLKKILKIQ